MQYQHINVFYLNRVPDVWQTLKGESEKKNVIMAMVYFFYLNLKINFYD